MTDERLPPMDAAEQLQKALARLGRQPSVPRSVDAERERAAHLAALMNSQLAELVASSRRRRIWSASLLAVAAAAAVIVGWAVERAPRPIAISHEPAASSRTRTEHPLASRQPAPVGLPAVPSEPAPRASSASSAAPAPMPMPSTEHATETESTLAEENRLFKRAADASRDGDVTSALAELDRLLQSHPASPLAQTALVRKFRLLAKAGRSDEAKREAERYLAAYPAGFAVREAQGLVRATPAPAGSESPSEPGQGP